MRAERAASLLETMLPKKCPFLRALLVLAATLSSGACESDDELMAANLCNGEGSSSCLAPGELSELMSSERKGESPSARGNGRWARGSSRKRKRRIAFSHEDMAGDASFRPLLQTFRDSLSGAGQDPIADTAGQEGLHPSSAADALRMSAAEEESEVIRVFGKKSQQHLRV